MPTSPNHFEELRRMAHDRGRRDYRRAQEEANQDGRPIFKNNPHQNNAATDEREAWEEGWEAERLECEDPGQYTATISHPEEWPFPVHYGKIPE